MYEEILRLRTRPWPANSLEIGRAHRPPDEGVDHRTYCEPCATGALRGGSPKACILQKGEDLHGLVYQRAIRDAEAGLRANKIKAKLTELDIWDPEYWAAQQEASLSNMRYKFAPQEIIDMQMKQMIYLGDNQWVVKPDADAEFASTIAEDEKGGKRAARQGRPSSSEPAELGDDPR